MRRVFAIVSFLWVVAGLGLVVSGDARAQAPAIGTTVTGVGGDLLGELLSKPISRSVATGAHLARTPVATATALGRVSPLGLGLTVGSLALQWCLSDAMCLGPKDAPDVEDTTGGGTETTSATYCPAMTCTAPSAIGYNISTKSYPATTAQDACTSYITTENAATLNPPGVLSAGVVPYAYYCRATSAKPGYTNPSPGTGMVQITSCPAGYVNSAGVCKNSAAYYFCPTTGGWVLSGTACNRTIDPRFAADGSPTWENNGGTWAAHPADPDSDGLPVPSSTITRRGVDAYGNPSADRITANADGSVTYETNVETTTNNNTYTTTNVVTVNNAGVVTSAQSKTTEGTIDQRDTAPRAAPLELPTDYAREPTLQELATEVKAEGWNPPPDQPARVAAAQADAAANASALDAQVRAEAESDKAKWFSWAWVPQLAECHAFDGSVHGFSVSWDVCPTVDLIRAILGWLFAVAGAWDIYGQLFRRSGNA